MAEIIEKHKLEYHFYADDSQIYVTFRPGESEESALQQMQECIAEVSEWLRQNMLKMNGDKTKLILFSSKYSKCRESPASIKVGGTEVVSANWVKNLGIFQDDVLSMENQINNICCMGYYHLHNIGRVRRYLTNDSTKILVHSLVLSRIDYGNALLYGVNDCYLNKLQRLQNLAARVICKVPRRDHITQQLVSLHWLPIRCRIEYKVLLYVYKIVYGLAPSYLSDLLDIYTPGRSLRSQNSVCLRLPRV